MTNKESKCWEWFIRILPFLILMALLVPGERWAAKEIRTFAGLITVLILPGYALARGLRLFERFDNWLDVLSLSVALTWSMGLALWLLFFFLGVSLQIVSFTWLGLTLAGLIASTFIPLPRWLTARPARPWLIAGLLGWIAVTAGAVYLYGGRVNGDAYSYMTWLRNVRVGDIRPGVNVHASWETNYPFFKNLYAPTYIYYAMTSFLARVDTNWVWSRAPTFWTPVMFAVQFSLTRQLFKRKVVGYVLILLLPLTYAGRPLFTSIGDSHHICNFVLLPLAFWLFLRAVFTKHKQALWWRGASAALVAASLTFEHLPHIVHFLLVVGIFTLLYIWPSHKRVFWRCVICILAVLLIIAPFLWHTLQLAAAYGFDPQQSTTANLNMGEVGRAERFLKLGGERFFIVRPQKLLAGQSLPWLTILGIIFVLGYFRSLGRGTARLVIASFATAFLIGFNPLLTPLLSRMVAPHAAHRLSEALIIFPVLAYGVTRVGLKLRNSWRHRRHLNYGLATLMLIFTLLVGYNLTREAIEAVEMKVRNVVYTPAHANPNLSDRLIRQMIENELASPPYPILDPPAQLIRYLDAETLQFIRQEIPRDSVFLSERLTEYNLPPYADQLTYLGRFGWPKWGDICPRVRTEGAETAFPRVRRPEVYHRLNVACAILNPDADPQEIETLLNENAAEIDYLLVTPNTAYLRKSLDLVMPQAQVFDNGDFAIYAVQARP